ncbi:hypothetical protein C0991_006124, partial [Blastosporella zonata]
MVTIVKTFARKPELHNPALLWFLAACVSDILITASLVFSLHTALNFLWDLALSKLYSNCLLSTLNARASMREITSSSQGPRISSGVRRQIDTFESQHDNLTSPTFELDAQKSFDPSSTYPRDVEFGITVTK